MLISSEIVLAIQSQHLIHQYRSGEAVQLSQLLRETTVNIQYTMGVLEVCYDELECVPFSNYMRVISPIVLKLFKFSFTEWKAANSAKLKNRIHETYHVFDASSK